MIAFFESLREFNIYSMILRLILAMLAGGAIGFGRSRKKRAAGFRTYMLASIGAALTVLLASYEYEMLCGPWADAVGAVGLKYDGARYATSAIGGIGFLAAGTILSSGHQQVSGLSTAAGLFAAVCMGIAAGAGFYECAVIAFVLLILFLDVLAPLEPAFKRRLRNITLYVEFNRIEDMTVIAETITSRKGEIFDTDIERMEKSGSKWPAAILVIRMSRHHSSHSEMLSSIAELPCVHSIQELIS